MVDEVVTRAECGVLMEYLRQQGSSVSSLRLTTAELWKTLIILVPLMGALIAGGLRFNSKLEAMANTQQNQTEKIDAQAQKQATSDARMSSMETNQLRIMFYLRIPLDDMPQFRVTPAQHAQIVKQRKPLTPPPPAPVVEALKGHALFELPQTIASAPPPFISTVDDH